MDLGTAPAPLGSPDIDDATRMAASTRMNIVMPAHATVVPDDLSDEQIITQHMVQPAVANAANDTENTTGDASANFKSQRVHSVALTISIVVSLLLTGLLAYIFIALA